MPPLLWINGAVVDSQVELDAAAGTPTISAFDAGVQHGVGLFETMLAAGGRVVDLGAHLERLGRSARELSLTEALHLDPLERALELCVERSELATGEGRARVRLTITGGDLNMLTQARAGSGPPTDRTPTVLIHVTPAQQYPAEMFERGVSVVIAETKANPLNHFEAHKTLNYWWRLAALQRAASVGAGEAIVLQVTNHLCGGAVSNVFVVKDSVVRTPIARGEEDGASGKALPSPVLPGVTRACIEAFCAGMGVGVEKRMLSVDDLLDADEVFLTNSSWGVLPVVKVEQSAIGDAVPGRLTKQLREAWQVHVLGA